MGRAVESERATALVGRAQRGDRQAVAELVGGHLPLVYNIVGRALAGHPDTDDVVQETMLRAVDGLPSLRDPAGFRSWLVAIAVNQVRRRHRDAAPVHDVPDPTAVADPAGDFVGLTIVRLGLSEQRREVAEATRWLDEGDRDLLALWWQEAAGELTRAELAAALDVSQQHAAVRVQRMKNQLESVRVAVRALAAVPPCPWLAELTAGWDGVPSALWRKRIGRHVRECGMCAEHRRDLVPAEGLLAGLALVPLPDDPRYHFDPTSHQVSSGGSGSHRPGGGSHRRGGPNRRGGGHRAAGRSGPGRSRLLMGGGVVGVVAAGLLAMSLSDSPPATGLAEQPPGSAPAVPATLVAPADGTDSASPSAIPSPSPSAASSSAPAPAKPSAAPSTASRTVDLAQQVLELVNTERAKNNCPPVKSNAQLATAAQKHSDDMAARSFFDHTNPDGAGPQQRIDAAGYRWSAWGENIARGQKDASSVMDSWMNSPGHRANILNCGYAELGVGIHLGAGGPWWTQDFGTPR
ncbi:sigma-70 family RNA polymerase sigma factor [Kitasatospora sp. NPDC049285]|uniref:sigma-70 family RNA polymerase sigma factor n=1 Tax=Kitasatospora sp. NPDC049285 TaxID=3157096 RepID=UPI0034259132